MKKASTSERLRELMEERGLRQVDILNLCQPYCHKYGVTLSKSHLSQYLKGSFEPKQDKLTVLAHALNVSEVWLMGLSDDPVPHHHSYATNLSHYEISIIETFRLLNIEGKRKVENYMQDLIDSGRYAFAAQNREKGSR